MPPAAARRRVTHVQPAAQSDRTDYLCLLPWQAGGADKLLQSMRRHVGMESLGKFTNEQLKAMNGRQMSDIIRGGADEYREVIHGSTKQPGMAGFYDKSKIMSKERWRDALVHFYTT
jgi:hypothetical protein